MRFNPAILLSLPLLLIGIYGCPNPNEADCEKHYNFTIPVTISPAKDTFHVGDTIWVESIVENFLVNNLDGSETDLSQLPLKFDASVDEYNQNGYVFSSQLFSYINETGAFKFADLGGPTYLKVSYEDVDNHARKFKVGIVINSIGTGEGTFNLEFGYLTPDYEAYEVLNKKCLDIIAFQFDANEGRDSSSYYLLPPTYTGVVTMGNFLKHGSFAFRVLP